uniref:Uncharacterized protein n=1 Tax=Knipowitschia caucasica TaxID=637954 RepID=A0AAV2KVR9_KNICA
MIIRRGVAYEALRLLSLTVRLHDELKGYLGRQFDNVLPSSHICYCGDNPTKDLIKAGKELLWPAEYDLPPGQVVQKGFVAVAGKVLKMFPLKWESKTGVPLRDVLLDHGGTPLQVTLWREATLLELTEGKHVVLHHLKGHMFGTVFKLNSTTLTTISEPSRNIRVLKIEGTSAELDSGDCLVLTEDGEMFRVAEKRWSLHDRTDFLIEADVEADRILSYIVKDHEAEE